MSELERKSEVALFMFIEFGELFERAAAIVIAAAREFGEQ